MRNSGIDSLRFILALLVITLHISFIYQNVFVPISICAVPCFFIISGFLMYGKETSYPRTLHKITLYFILSSLIYIAIGLMLPTYYPIIGNDNVYGINILKSLLLFNVTKYGQHLWYLIAYIYVLGIMILLHQCKWIDKIAVYIFALILLLTHLALGEFSIYLFGKPLWIAFVRNFLFTGFPFFMIGRFLARINIKRLVTTKMCIILICWGVAGSYIEDTLSLASNVELYVSTIILSVSLFLISILGGQKNSVLARLGKECSLPLYIIHPMVYCCLSDFLPSYSSITYTIIVSFGICYLFSISQKKNKISA